MDKDLLPTFVDPSAFEFVLQRLRGSRTLYYHYHYQHNYYCCGSCCCCCSCCCYCQCCCCCCYCCCYYWGWGQFRFLDSSSKSGPLLKSQLHFNSSSLNLLEKTIPIPDDFFYNSYELIYVVTIENALLTNTKSILIPRYVS